MRHILDTNVLVSAIIQKSYPFLLVDRILADSSLHICLSESLFAEYIDVLNRDKFSRFADFQAKAQALLADLEGRALRFTPTVSVDIISDGADNRLLELAEVCKADFLVTGNTRDFTMSDYKGTKIISPKDFFALLTH